MWLSNDQAYSLVSEHGSPLFVYSKNMLQERARQLMVLQLPYGLTPRYAVKANPHPEIITPFMQEGLHFDASSSYEATELLELGIPGDRISLSSQQPAHNLEQLIKAGIRYVATSMHQLQLATQAMPAGTHVALRVNPGIGSGHNNRTSTGGVTSSFGLWHEYLDEALGLAAVHQLTVDRLHIHIGSGADPAVWGQVMEVALQLVNRMPQVTILDIGGGYKVSRSRGEPEADMRTIAAIFSQHLRNFAQQTGRQLHLEIEPGTWLVAHAGTLLASVTDVVDTGRDGYNFLRLDTGMNDIIRPSMYGAQHQMAVLNNVAEQDDYVVVGHNCETGDVLTPAPGNPEDLMPRRLNVASIGDVIAVADVGAYCASMSVKGYNSFPPAAEVLV